MAYKTQHTHGSAASSSNVPRELPSAARNRPGLKWFLAYLSARCLDCCCFSHTLTIYPKTNTLQSAYLLMTVSSTGEVINDFGSQILQEDLDLLSAWERKWQMKFNCQKCFVMHISQVLQKSKIFFILPGWFNTFHSHLPSLPQCLYYSENSIIRARLIRETAYYELEDMVPTFAYYLLYKMSCLIQGK